MSKETSMAPGHLSHNPGFDDVVMGADDAHVDLEDHHEDEGLDPSDIIDNYEAYEDEDEVNRAGSLCWRILSKLRLERCFEKQVVVPKKGQPVNSIKLKVPLTRQFVKEQAQLGEQARRRNSVRTSKYSVWTFIPLSIAHQFKRFVNMFFLVIVILLVIGNSFPTWYLTPWQATGTATYLAVLVIAGMIVEGLDDLARHRGDRVENRAPVERVDYRDGTLVSSQWGKLLPGDMIVVNDRETFPADVIILYTTGNDARNVCYIETSSIDGETNLKIKDSPQAITKAAMSRMPEGTMRNSNAEKQEAAKSLAHVAQGVYEYEQPTAFLQFSGSFTPRSRRPKVPLEFNNLVLRGSTLRNTKWLIAMVMYSGPETKLALSRQTPRIKFSQIDHLANRLMFTMLALYLVICILADGMLFLQTDTSNWWYFQYTSSTSGYVFPGWLAFFITFCILFSNLIPISLVLLVEIINKYLQFIINNDLKMYHEETDTPARCKTASLSAEIGQITHFFSDKTGTLTRNEMKLVGCVVNGVKYGYKPPPVNEETGGPIDVIQEEEVVVEQQENEAPERTSSTCSGINQVEIFEDALELLSSKATSKKRRALVDLLVFLGVCHTVILDKDPETGEVKFNAESPDEEAFVKGVNALGIKLVTASDGIVEVDTPNGREKYQILAVNPFNSARKRMSLVVCRDDGSIAILMKGADNVMFARMANGQEQKLHTLQRFLLEYAWSGLRTLVMAKREIGEEEYLKWKKIHDQALVAPSAVRSEELAKAAELVEANMELVGATAIEDQLQEGVPEAIQSLRDAGIQVWVVTGDKIETAINIGLSSRLLDSTMLQLKLVSDDPKELEQRLDAILTILDTAIREEESMNEVPKQGLKSTPSGAISRSEVASAYAAECLALIVSGASLELLLEAQKGSFELEHKLLKVARCCKVVLACRASPKQKALIVTMVKDAPDNKMLEREPITLGIGDGANDVPMLQSSHVGIGISGHEGLQAVNSADFSIAQFRFVVRLLLIHGRWNYRRHANVLLYLVYCWIVYILVIYIFQPYTIWSGQQVYYEYYYTFFAPFLLNFAIIAHGWFNKDLSEEFVMKHPWVYACGAKNEDLNLYRLFIVVLRSGVHLLFIWLFVFLSSPLTTGQATFGSTTFTVVFFVLFYDQLFRGLTYNAITFACFAFLLLCFLVGMSLVTTPAYLFYPEADPALAWTQIIFTVILVAVSDYAWHSIQKEVFPTELDLLIEQDRVLRNPKEDVLNIFKETAKFVVSPIPIAAAKFKSAVQEEGDGTETTDSDNMLEDVNASVELVPQTRPASLPLEHVQPGFNFDYMEGGVGEGTMAPSSPAASALRHRSVDMGTSHSAARLATSTYVSRRHMSTIN